jgi:hypothetical protein
MLPQEKFALMNPSEIFRTIRKGQSRGGGVLRDANILAAFFHYVELIEEV